MGCNATGTFHLLPGLKWGICVLCHSSPLTGQTSYILIMTWDSLGMERIGGRGRGGGREWGREKGQEEDNSLQNS